MEKIKVTIEVTFEEARFVLNEIEQFRAAKAKHPEPLIVQRGKRYKRRDGEITDELKENGEVTYRL